MIGFLADALTGRLWMEAQHISGVAGRTNPLLNMRSQKRMMLPNLIGIYSPVMRSGKSLIARTLEDDYGYSVHKFAATLKRMLHVFLTDFGYSVGEVTRMLEGDLKHETIPELNKPARHLPQTLGTEWGRTHLHPDVWVWIAERLARRDSQPVVFDDMRFKNEYDYIRKNGGVLIKVDRPDAKSPNQHTSEGQLDSLPFDHYLHNIGTVDELKAQVHTLMKAYSPNEAA